MISDDEIFKKYSEIDLDVIDTCVLKCTPISMNYGSARDLIKQLDIAGFEIIKRRSNGNN